MPGVLITAFHEADEESRTLGGARMTGGQAHHVLPLGIVGVAHQHPEVRGLDGSAGAKVVLESYSAMPVPGAQNGAAGPARRLYNSNRIIDGVEDAFIVKVD
ncbi:hypothetical protein [Streptomyces sp. TBY4]|uniref:hypothetical protein n=1 Tax=Streptomyces sp. TBY4 TaxID=2962030 RepID=UPI0027E4EBCE|nr:hypothetical protein [Streptomyces sp. TBY4]